jgi:magnesium transporter
MPNRGTLVSGRRRTQGKAAKRPPEHERGQTAVKTILFDKDRVDSLDKLPERPERLGGSKLLWVDIDRQNCETVDVVRAFELDEATCDRLESSSEHAVFHDYDRYIHVTTYSPSEEEDGDLMPLECVVGKKWVITAHDQAIPVLEEFAERASGSGNTGVLDGPAFLATLLEWVLGAYSAAFERLEERLEEFDVQAMRGQGAEQDIEQLVGMRREVGLLRRALAAHRSALTALTHPELEALGNDASEERFRSLLTRFEATVQEARDAREAIVGSFDVLIARTGHKTNSIMKILTLTSVILLPGALLAGVMGMNFKVGLFQATWLFYVVLFAIVGIAALTLGMAKLRDWI